MFQTSSTVSGINEVEKIAQVAGFSILTPLQKSLLSQAKDGKDLFAHTYNKKGKALAVILTVLQRLESTPGGRALIITPESGDVGKLNALMANLITQNELRYHSVSLGPTRDSKHFFDNLDRTPDIIIGNTGRIIDHIRRNNIPLHNTTIAAVFISRNEVKDEFRQDLEFIFSKLERNTQALFLSPNETDMAMMEEISRKPAALIVSEMTEEEAPTMSKKNEDFNQDAVKEAIETILSNIRSSEDPHEMDIYKKMIRRHVPLTMRSYVGAYLLKQMTERGGTKFSRPRRESRGKNVGVTGGEGRSTMPTPGYTTLFFSIGKNRRVFPKDLSRLLSTAAKLESDDVGTIRILDSYSFIEVKDAKTAEVIDILNNSEFRGRKLTVNYAKKR